MASGYMFSAYWPGDGIVNDVPVTITQYPAWQSVITGLVLLFLWV